MTYKHTYSRQIPVLSKSRFMAGMQCYKRLYLELFHPEFADPVSLSQQMRFDAGTHVGQLARELFPGGVLITEDHFHHKKAVTSTETVLSDESLPAIFEAAFLHDDVRVRADVLARVNKNTFDLIEVKSSTETKEEHYPDVAVQLYVIQGCGINIRRACLCHINKEYVYQGGDYDLDKLLTIDDITNDVMALLPDVPILLTKMRKYLQCPEPLDITPKRQCSKPYTCEFFSYCHRDFPEHHISQLPRAGEKLLIALEEEGIDDIRNIPSSFAGLNATQKRVRDCVVNGYIFLDQSLKNEFNKLEYPIYFLDFETFNPALPVYVGTRPYQVIPFQWSLHILNEARVLTHMEYLHDGLDDPREQLAQNLVDALGTKGSIVVYSSFEATQIKNMAAALPHLSTRLLALLNGRIFDLLDCIRKYYYHPDFHGSFSIKSVLPAIVVGLDYTDLYICDGEQASWAYAEIIRPETTEKRLQELRNALKSYCRRDTEAEVRLLEALHGI